VFDLSIYKLLVLAVIALVVFGPNELPKVTSQAARWIRDLRRIAESARSDLREGLGPEFQNFEFQDLNPKAFVRKHLMDDFEAAMSAPAATAGQGQSPGQGGLATAASTQTALAPGEAPPYDVEAT
jgi:sec-independent protein translocase protein TatB